MAGRRKKPQKPSEKPATSRLGKARQAAGLDLATAAQKLGLTITLLRGLEDELYLPRPSEVSAMRRLYGAHFTQTEQGDLFAS